MSNFVSLCTLGRFYEFGPFSMANSKNGQPLAHYCTRSTVKHKRPRFIYSNKFRHSIIQINIHARPSHTPRERKRHNLRLEEFIILMFTSSCCLSLLLDDSRHFFSLSLGTDVSTQSLLQESKTSLI